MPSWSFPNRPAIEVNLHDLSQLFDPLDPSAVEERDLNHRIEEYIVDRLKLLPSNARTAIVVHLDRSAARADDERKATAAIRSYFTRRAESQTRELRQLFHRGRVSLAIGLSVLVVIFLMGQALFRFFGDGHVTTLLRDCSIIGGWVAMWKPLDIFLYQWWPIVSELRLYKMLSHMSVQVIPYNSRVATRIDLMDVSEIGRIPFLARNRFNNNNTLAQS